MKAGHLEKASCVAGVLALLVVGLPTARLMAQEERGSIPGLVLSSNAPGELAVSWETPDQPRTTGSPGRRRTGYPSWRDANEDDRGNAYPEGFLRGDRSRPGRSTVQMRTSTMMIPVLSGAVHGRRPP